MHVGMARLLSRSRSLSLLVPATPSEAPPETTAAPFTRLIDLVAEPPQWEDVTFTTADDVELYARFWPGGSTALLVGHDYSVTTAGAFGQRPDQSSEAILQFTGTFASEGYTVLSPDYRGHGLFVSHRAGLRQDRDGGLDRLRHDRGCARRCR